MIRSIDISLDSRHRLRSDEHAFVIVKKGVVKDETVWRPVSWHVKLEHAVKSYRTRCIRQCGARTFEELLDAINRIDRGLDSACQLSGETRTAGRQNPAVPREEGGGSAKAVAPSARKRKRSSKRARNQEVKEESGHGLDSHPRLFSLIPDAIPAGSRIAKSA
jgi:hypothetical protein